MLVIKLLISLELKEVSDCFSDDRTPLKEATAAVSQLRNGSRASIVHTGFKTLPDCSLHLGLDAMNTLGKQSRMQL